MINDIIRHIKGRLGAYTRKLEISDEAIISILEQETLPTLSVYFPYYIDYILDTEDSRLPDTRNQFYLPSEIEGFYLLGVERVLPAMGGSQSTGMGNVYGGVMPSINNYINMKLDATILSAFMIPDTFTFFPPNTIRLNGELNFTAYKRMLLTLKVTHNKNFSTFHPGLRETIMKLAMFDVSLDILGIRKYFQNLSTTFGEVDLNLDILEVSDKRDDLIESLRKNQLKNSVIKKIYIA